jgi:hypothetical protein
MHKLLYTLQDQDIGHLKIIANFWGLELPNQGTPAAAEWLASAMLQVDNLLEMIDSLPEQAREPWEDLLLHHGRYSYADMIRKHGPIREMGAGRRDRKKPWRDPVSGLEILWYRGLIARAFLDTSTGAQEFLYIPSDLLQQIPLPETPNHWVPGRETSAPLNIKPASKTLLADVTTLLASLRKEPAKSDDIDSPRKEALAPFLHHPQSAAFIFSLLKEIGLLSSRPTHPLPEPTREFFDLSRLKATTKLMHAWRDSASWNDLQQVKNLRTQGDVWPNDPLLSRLAVLDFLQRVPQGKWWDLDSFIHFIYSHTPGFLRPAGDFDSWYVQNAETGEFLRGFEFWNDIEGALIRHIITQPAYFLGAVDLGGMDPANRMTSFRLTPISKILFDDEPPSDVHQEPIPLNVFPDGKILAPPSSSQVHRYQVARFCDWINLSDKGYQYRISPSALQRATDQGLNLHQITSILEIAHQGSLHPSLKRALIRWSEKGGEATLEKIIMLRVKDQQVMDLLQSKGSTSRFLQEILGPTTAVVRERDLEKLWSAASKLGIFIDLP